MPSRLRQFLAGLLAGLLLSAGAPTLAGGGEGGRGGGGSGGDGCAVIQPGFWVIGGQCVTAGTTQPGIPCMFCNPSVSQTAWTPSQAGTTCPGGFCDGNGSCVQSP